MSVASNQLLPLSGDTLIDALTNGTYWRLDDNRTIQWAVADGFKGEGRWSNPTEAVQNLQRALSNVSYYADVKFQYVGIHADPAAAFNSGSDITLSLSDSRVLFPSTSTWALAFFPFTPELYPGASGDMFLNTRSPGARLPSYEPGSDGFFLLLHELGHALGLKHPHDDGGTGRPTFSSIGLKQFDQDFASVMSYKDELGYDLVRYDPATFMVFDVLALQALYGKNNNTNTGDGRYELSELNLYATIWDAGGNDTVDVSAATTGWTVSLQSDPVSTLVPEAIGYALPTNNLSLSAPKTLFWMLGDIENAIGSRFSDSLIGNALPNLLRGGQGNDTINGGDGSDTAVFSGNRADYTIAVNAKGDFTVADKAANRDGTDTLSQIEQLQFSDQTITVNAAWAALPFPDLFAANLSQAKAIASAYQTLLGGIPGISGFDFLIKANLTSNFGASPSAVFNDENVFINVVNALVQGNAEATSKFNTLAAGTTLSAKISSLYKSIIPDAKQSADGIAFFTRPDGLKFYQDVAKERGITAENGPAVIALASILKVAVDGKIGIGNPVSDLIASIADGSSGLPAGSATVLQIETIDGTKFDADDASDALPGFSGLAPASVPLIGIIADTEVMF